MKQDISLKKFILVKKRTMDHLEDENYPIKRPAFLTVLCILTFIGSGWALFSAVSSYKSAESTVAIFNDSAIERRSASKVKTDSIKNINDVRNLDTKNNNQNSTESLLDSARNETDPSLDSVIKDNLTDSTREEFDMGRVIGENVKKNIMDMISVEKIKQSALGSFVAALFTLAGAVFMWLLRKFGFYLYIIGIIIGIIVPFYIYGNNLWAIGISGFGSFFGLVFIALYALNLKSMK